MVCNKNGKNNAWSEYTGPLASTGQSGGDGDSFVINVDPEKEQHNGRNYILHKGNGIKLYKIRNNRKCSKVKFGSKEVWYYEEGDYLQYVRYVKNDNKVELDFKGVVTKTYKKNDGKWTEETEGIQTGYD